MKYVLLCAIRVHFTTTEREKLKRKTFLPLRLSPITAP